jgi:hypothetical protein
MTTPVVDEKYELDSPTYDKKEFTDGDSHSQVIVDERTENQRLNEEYHFTWRSAIVGSLLGCLVGTKIELLNKQINTPIY